ncbi:hypothetical protein PIN31115_02090 [Pandoraea iniqua]|uniref:Peptidase S74 domain-containing protein n=1 Tax=Pandoraea iniqua TaxID=2508288 RepID=A0A5E4UL29_9BURK|nr:tail fiber domain-containing protein [Pandoraea iniqua]VVE00738.1 hypothetical protein PIN31115_02090 [Pandoraea iniqua]
MRHSYLSFDAPDLPARAFRKALFKNSPQTLEGGGKGGSAPSPPDPYAVAGATTQTNQQSAAYNKALNLGNYSNPFGSQQSSISGYDPATGAPIYQTNISASPQLQGAMNGLFGQIGQSGGINQNALNGLSGLLSTYQAVNQGYAGLNPQLTDISKGLNQQAAQNAQQQGQDSAYKAQTQYLDPQYSQGQESLQASLANQGLTPGSQAYTNAMTNFNNQKQQAYSNAANQAIMTGSQIGTQNWQNQLAGAQAQAGLIGQQAGLFGQMQNNLQGQAGLYGQQVGIGQAPYSNLQSIASMIPGYSGTAQSAAQPANIGQNIYSNYQGQMNQYNANQASGNSFMGGLFGLGSAGILGLSLSDRRLKRGIKRIGTWANGLPVYTYRYVWEKVGVRHIGFMAGDVKSIRPAAVVKHPTGFDMVNYRVAGA